MSELDTFLGAGKQDADASAAPDPVEELLGVPSEPQRDAKPEAEEKPEQDDADADPPVETRDGRTVPLAALEAERAQRRDWKIEATKAQTERDELRRQLEEAKRPVAAPPPAPLPPPDPSQDPQGFVSRVQQVVLNERLNTSELLVRKELGAEAVDAAVAEFKQAVAKNPSLQTELYQQPHPYEWVVRQVETMRLQREIGDDPKAYRERLRAEIEAELGQTQQRAPAPSPAAGLPPSLATARSAAPRSAPAYSGPTPLDDILRR